jgi:hypothetical protein
MSQAKGDIAFATFCLTLARASGLFPHPARAIYPAAADSFARAPVAGGVSGGHGDMWLYIRFL